MAHLIRFADGVMVEVSRNPNPAEPVAGKAAERMTQAFQAAADIVASLLRTVLGSTTKALRDAGAVEAEIEFGVGFSIEGNVFVTKVTGEGSFSIKATIHAAQN